MRPQGALWIVSSGKPRNSRENLEPFGLGFAAGGYRLPSPGQLDLPLLGAPGRRAEGFWGSLRDPGLQPFDELPEVDSTPCPDLITEIDWHR